MSLQHEIQQTKPFPSLEAEAALSVARTAAVLGSELSEVLKLHNLTPTQYNVLRILRGAKENGLCRHEVGDCLVTPVPDVTRLLDRLEEAGLVNRTRNPEDQRQVKARITLRGLDLLAQLDGIIDDLHRRQLGHMSEAQIRTLIDLLSIARERK